MRGKEAGRKRKEEGEERGDKTIWRREEREYKTSTWTDKGRKGKGRLTKEGKETEEIKRTINGHKLKEGRGKKVLPKMETEKGEERKE